MTYRSNLGTSLSPGREPVSVDHALTRKEARRERHAANVRRLRHVLSWNEPEAAPAQGQRSVLPGKARKLGILFVGRLHVVEHTQHRLPVAATGCDPQQITRSEQCIQRTHDRFIVALRGATY